MAARTLGAVEPDRTWPASDKVAVLDQNLADDPPSIRWTNLQLESATTVPGVITEACYAADGLELAICVECVSWFTAANASSRDFLRLDGSWQRPKEAARP